MSVRRTDPQRNKIVLIGAGNVATHLGEALQKANHSIIQVYSKTQRSAELLGKKLHTTYTSKLNQLLPNADIYVITVKDDAITEVAKLLRTSGTVVHTSGTTNRDVLKQCSSSYGVFYPLQTFSKGRKINMANIPFCIEANTKKTAKQLEILASTISENVYSIPSEKRKIIHLAAVFASNFSNHMYTIAAAILQEKKIPFKLLGPLIEETAAKAKDHHPRKVQTGPAIRKDQKSIKEHLKLLSKNKDLKDMYRLISKHIIEF